MASPLKPCDLVMKGGITSGVVYPAAVLELSKTHTFRSVGGTSAGAIAAAVTAAAEYGRHTGGFDALTTVIEDLRRPGFLHGLFQPSPRTRAAFEILLGMVARGRSRSSRIATTAWLALRSAWMVSVPAALVCMAAVTLVVAQTRGVARPAASALTLLVSLAAMGAVTVVALVLLTMRLKAGIEANGLGICSGMRAPGNDHPALTEWLHERIQACAGLEPSAPLTFRMLQEHDEPITLKMMTTDLSYSRPVVLPFEERRYLFDVADMERLFPSDVVRHMVEHSEPAGEDLAYWLRDEAASHRYVPLDDLPVVVAARMSLSFPVLISTVPLHSFDPMIAGLVRSCFSDGGITSNFPVHFFDAWFPGRPTFAFDLQPFPADGRTSDDVVMPSDPRQQLPPRWSGVDGLGAFARQIADCMQNWRDTVHSELPGFRDRVCQIRLAGHEGGINLNMDAPTIAGLVEKGRKAGATIEATFDERRWAQHRFTRYLTLMQMMQRGLGRMRKPWKEFSPVLAAGAPEVEAFRRCHDADWCRDAEAATTSLIEVARTWGDGGIDFDRGLDCEDDDPRRCTPCEPEPTPAMRITPRA